MDVSFKDSRAQVTETISPPEWLMDAALMRIHAGALPREQQSRVMAGPGRRQICALCDHPIETGDVGYRVTPEGATEERPYLHFHRSEEHTSELQSRENLVCRLLLEKKNTDQ